MPVCPSITLTRCPVDFTADLPLWRMNQEMCGCGTCYWQGSKDCYKSPSVLA